MNLPSAWYLIADSCEIPNHKPLALKRLGLNLVIWRHNEKVYALEDLCPHRSAKLSLGTIKAETIECPFHGFKYSALGNCIYVPETDKDAPNLCVKAFTVCEQNAFIFIKHGQPLDLNPPWFDALTKMTCYSGFTSLWPSHVTRCIENQLDYAHLPYVHKTTIGKNIDKNMQVKFEFTNQSIKMYTNAQNSTSTSFEFKFGNIWLLNILPDKFTQFLAFVPIDEHNTKLYLRTYQNFLKIPVLKELLGLIFNQQSKIILNQDKRVVLSQRPLNSLESLNENLYPSDKGIIYFRQAWQKGIAKSDD